jgi:hypothetical protein
VTAAAVTSPAAAGASVVPRYAVALRTHVWDGYVARQCQRLVERAPGGDVFVLLDETNGPVPVDEGRRVVSHTQAGCKALGLADAGTGNMLWYNGDYPLYCFFHEQPGYAYYVMAEYDVAVHGSIDAMIARVARDGTGFVGLTKGEAVEDWPHTPSLLDAYAPEDVKKRLICFSIFSRDAVRALFEHRLALSRALAEGAIRRWPYCEGYIPTELARQGFSLAELSELGSTDLYDWKPAVAEADLPSLQQHTFIHPVLDGPRYVQAMLKENWSLKDVVNPWSTIMRRLRRVPRDVYGPPLAAAVRKRLGRQMAGTLGRHQTGGEGLSRG